MLDKNTLVKLNKKQLTILVTNSWQTKLGQMFKKKEQGCTKKQGENV